MKLATLALGALIALPAQQLAAQQDLTPHVRIDDNGDSDVVRPGARHTADAHMAITTTDQAASLVLTRRVVALQLTDHMLRRVDAEMAHESRRENNGIFASMIVSAVRGTVGNVLRRSLEVPIRDLRTVDYRNGRLIFVTEDGDRIFENVEIDDTDVTTSFRPQDAQAFVREFRALKARTR